MNARRCRDRSSEILLQSAFLISLPIFVGSCESLKPDQIPWCSESAGNGFVSALCRSKSVTRTAHDVPVTFETSTNPKCSTLTSYLKVEQSAESARSEHFPPCPETPEMLGLSGGCRLRGGAKSHRTMCSHKGCKSTYMPLAGDCPYCSSRFCMSHRLPEVLKPPPSLPPIIY
jgi:hypothetical protein